MDSNGNANQNTMSHTTDPRHRRRMPLRVPGIKYPDGRGNFLEYVASSKLQGVASVPGEPYVLRMTQGLGRPTIPYTGPDIDGFPCQIYPRSRSVLTMAPTRSPQGLRTTLDQSQPAEAAAARLLTGPAQYNPFVPSGGADVLAPPSTRPTTDSPAQPTERASIAHQPEGSSNRSAARRKGRYSDSQSPVPHTTTANVNRTASRQLIDNVRSALRDPNTRDAALRTLNESTDTVQRDINDIVGLLTDVANAPLNPFSLNIINSINRTVAQAAPAAPAAPTTRMINITYIMGEFLPTGAERECAICQDLMNNNDEVMSHFLCARHFFHASCLAAWVAAKAPREATCPMCRRPISQTRRPLPARQSATALSRPLLRRRPAPAHRPAHTGQQFSSAGLRSALQPTGDLVRQPATQRGRPRAPMTDEQIEETLNGPWELPPALDWDTDSEQPNTDQGSGASPILVELDDLLDLND